MHAQVSAENIAVCGVHGVILSRLIVWSSLYSAGIGTVINLQLPGEHTRCGPRLESSGFTYHPEELMRHGGEGEEGGRERGREKENLGQKIDG